MPTQAKGISAQDSTGMGMQEDKQDLTAGATMVAPKFSDALTLFQPIITYLSTNVLSEPYVNLILRYVVHIQLQGRIQDFNIVGAEC